MFINHCKLICYPYSPSILTNLFDTLEKYNVFWNMIYYWIVDDITLIILLTIILLLYYYILSSETHLTSTRTPKVDTGTESDS